MRIYSPQTNKFLLEEQKSIFLLLFVNCDDKGQLPRGICFIILFMYTILCTGIDFIICTFIFVFTIYIKICRLIEINPISKMI